jgi:transcriptional regulator with XRE-family HTH domain
MRTVKIDLKETGRKIKAQMVKEGMTTDHITAALGYANRSTVNRWLRGEAMPSYENLVNLSILFGCKIRDLTAFKEVE